MSGPLDDAGIVVRAGLAWVRHGDGSWHSGEDETNAHVHVWAVDDGWAYSIGKNCIGRVVVGSRDDAMVAASGELSGQMQELRELFDEGAEGARIVAGAVINGPLVDLREANARLTAELEHMTTARDVASDYADDIAREADSLVASVRNERDAAQANDRKVAADLREANARLTTELEHMTTNRDGASDYADEVQRELDAAIANLDAQTRGHGKTQNKLNRSRDIAKKMSRRVAELSGRLCDVYDALGVAEPERSAKP